MKTERTSKRIASIAAWIMRAKPSFHSALDENGDEVGDPNKYCMVSKGEWAKIRALAASALTQSPDKPKRKAKAKK